MLNKEIALFFLVTEATALVGPFVDTVCTALLFTSLTTGRLKNVYRYIFFFKRREIFSRQWEWGKSNPAYTLLVTCNQAQLYHCSYVFLCRGSSSGKGLPTK